MGSAQLGPKWMRRIRRVTGLDVVHASGFGGYVFQFTTTDHVHGWFDLKAYRNTEDEIWGLYDTCPRYASCRRLFSA